MRILISGAGTAGLCAGVDLARAGHEVEIVERTDRLRANGSPIDVRGAAIEVARDMGILDAVLARRITMTERTRFVDRSGADVAPLVTQEIDETPDDVELPREDLVAILRAALPEQVDLRFGESVVALDDDGERVAVSFASGRADAYDLVVGADGAHSAVRRLVFGAEEEFSEHLGVYVAIGEAPGQVVPGGSRVTEILNLPGRFAGVARYHDKALAIFEFRSGPIEYDHHDPVAQKRLLAEAFAGIEDWKVPELISAAQDDPDLYVDGLAQIVMPTWSRGRVVLIGDAAHCATPMAGRGVSLALLGAWTLTEELARHDDLGVAFDAYEQRHRPHVTAAQEFARGGADLMVPATWEAIEARNARLRALRPGEAHRGATGGGASPGEGAGTPRTPRDVIEDVRRMLSGHGPEISTLFAADGVLRYPFAPPGTPVELSGRETIREFHRAAGSSKDLVDTGEVEAVVRQTDDPEVVVAEFSYRGWSYATGAPCSFRALAVVRVRDGLIESYEDYIDSIALARMLGRTRELADALTA